MVLILSVLRNLDLNPTLSISTLQLITSSFRGSAGGAPPREPPAGALGTVELTLGLLFALAREKSLGAEGTMGAVDGYVAENDRSLGDAAGDGGLLLLLLLIDKSRVGDGVPTAAAAAALAVWDTLI